MLIDTQLLLFQIHPSSNVCNSPWNYGQCADISIIRLIVFQKLKFGGHNTGKRILIFKWFPVQFYLIRIHLSFYILLPIDRCTVTACYTSHNITSNGECARVNFKKPNHELVLCFGIIAHFVLFYYHNFGLPKILPSLNLVKIRL